MADVWCFGDNTVDRYTGDINLSLLGGNAINVAAQLSRGPMTVTYCGNVGDDGLGAWLLDRIRDAGLGTERVHIGPGDSAITIVRVEESGDRYFEREDFGVTAAFRPSTDDVLHAASSDWVHIGMLPGAEAVKRDLKAINPSLLISQDCAVTPGLTDVDYVFLSAGEDDALAMAMCREAFEHAAPRVAISTMGALGSLAFDGDRWYRTAAVATEVVDTTGAGDSFIAGFIEATLTGIGIEGAMRRGAQQAAATCSHLGGFPQPIDE